MTANRMEPQHGTRSRYRKGCREECCRSVEREHMRRYRAQLARWKALRGAAKSAGGA